MILINQHTSSLHVRYTLLFSLCKMFGQGPKEKLGQRSIINSLVFNEHKIERSAFMSAEICRGSEDICFLMYFLQIADNSEFNSLGT